MSEVHQTENENQEGQHEPITVDESKLTPVPLVDLERARAERATARRGVSNCKRVMRKSRARLRVYGQARSLGRPLRRALKFNPDIDKLLVLAEYKSGIQFSVDTRGKLAAHCNGSPMAPIDALKKMALDMPEVVNKTCRGWRDIRLEPGRGIQSKAHFQSSMTGSNSSTSTG